MFKFLKEKIGKWAKSLSQKAEESKKNREKKEQKKTRELKSEFKEVEKRKVDKEEREIGEKIWEDIKEEEKKGFFKKLGEKLIGQKISEEDFNQYSEELQMLLLENNVAFEVAEKIIKELKEQLIKEEFSKKEIEQKIKEILKQIIEEILVEPFDLIEKIREKKSKIKEPYVILFCGINGTGKTTTIAKIAQVLKKNKISCVLSAADTFRTASIEQIKLHGEKLDIKVIAHGYGSDPASVGFDAINYAKKNFIDCVLIDTAGRMHTAKNLIKEIEKISKVCKPDCKIFVGESITGNDAIEQIKTFDEAISLDGIVLTKADIDEKGGTALSVGYITKKPILYLGTGQRYEDLEKFNKKKFTKNLGLEN